MADKETGMTPHEMREYVMSAPAPLDGPPIWERPESQHTSEVDGTTSMRHGYEMSALAAAKAMLIVADADPTLLSLPSVEDDPSGLDRAYSDKPWQAAKERWPGLDEWLGGISGFQFGWANNAIRYILGTEAVGNPAVLTISTP